MCSIYSFHEKLMSASLYFRIYAVALFSITTPHFSACGSMVRADLLCTIKNQVLLCRRRRSADCVSPNFHLSATPFKVHKLQQT